MTLTHFLDLPSMKSGRVEHLLQGRFHIEPVCVVEYLLTALRYIHQNLFKQGLHLIVEAIPGAAIMIT